MPAVEVYKTNLGHTAPDVIAQGNKQFFIHVFISYSLQDATDGRIQAVFDAVG